MDYIQIAIEELEKRNGISAGMARAQYRDMRKRITALETAASNVTVQLNSAIDPAEYPDIVIDRKDVIALAALLNNAEKE